MGFQRIHYWELKCDNCALIETVKMYSPTFICPQDWIYDWVQDKREQCTCSTRCHCHSGPKLRLFCSLGCVADFGTPVNNSLKVRISKR